MRLLVLAVLLTGCGVNGPIPPTTTTTTVPALDVSDFDVHADPRPIVLVGPPLVVVTGYANDREKLSAGRFTFTGTVPPTPEPGPVALPGRPAVLPLIGVPEAVAAMSGAGHQALELVSAEFGTAVFATDRGALTLPAWRFTTALGSVLAWPAVARSAFWRFGETPSSLHEAVTTDGRTFEVTLPDPGPPCPGEEATTVEPVVVETDRSVTIRTRTTGGGGRAEEDCARDASYRLKQHTVRLEEPLGARLLLDEQQGVMRVSRR